MAIARPIRQLALPHVQNEFVHTEPINSADKGFSGGIMIAMIVDSEERQTGTFISSHVASDISGYSKDYIGQLARRGAIHAKKIKGVWHVEKKSLLSHVASADEVKKKFGGRPSARKNSSSEIGKKYGHTAALTAQLPKKRRMANPLGKKDLRPVAYTSHMPVITQQFANTGSVVPPFTQAIDILQKTLFIAFFVALVTGSAHASFTTMTTPTPERLLSTIHTMTSNAFVPTAVAHAKVLPCTGLAMLTDTTNTNTKFDEGISATAAATYPFQLLAKTMCAK